MQITHDEKELLIECIETDLISRKLAAQVNFHPTYKEWYKGRKEDLESLIKKIREEL